MEDEGRSANVATPARSPDSGRAGNQPEGRSMFTYEPHSHPLLTFSAFLRRVAAHGGAALVLVAGSLGIGSVGYHYTEEMNWLDALLNASMILTGMGPVTGLRTPAGKLFASGYALYSGIVFLMVAGLVLAPFLHRLLHRLHLDETRDP